MERGHITLWFDKEAMEKHCKPEPTGKRGAPWRYSNWALQTGLVLKMGFHWPSRAREGLGRSLMSLMGLDRPIPDPSPRSRRAKTLEVQIPRQERTEPRPVVVDCTGLKVFGEGEWKVRQHRMGKRGTWLKVHLAVDAREQDVVGLEVTTVEGSDGEVFGDLVGQLEGTREQLDGDGPYDTRQAYELAAERKAKLGVPPREHAVAWEEEHPRTQALAEIEAKGPRPWKKDSGSHHRSGADQAIYRLKQLFGEGVAAHIFESQVNEVHARLAAMNQMTDLGRPISVQVGVAVS